MAAEGMIHTISRWPSRNMGRQRGAIVFAAVALLAITLSLAAALAGLSGGRSAAAPAGAAAELQLRQERIQFFEDRVKKDAIDTTSLNSLAGEYLQRARETGDVSDYERAAYAAGRVLEIVPDDYAGLVQSAQVDLAQHNFGASLDLVGQAIPVRPDIAAGYGVRGDAYVQLGRYDEAAKDFQKMVVLQPDLTSFSRLANLAYLRGDLLNANDFWKQAIASAKGLPLENEAWARVQLAMLYSDQGDLRNAEKQAQQALRVYPDYVHALAELGAVRAAQGRWEEAIDLYSRAQARLPQVQYVIALGDVYGAAGRPDDAQRQYGLVQAIDQLYRANGINTDLQISLFYANHDLNPADALLLAQNNYAANPGIYAADGLAWALYKNGRYEEAAALIEEALRLKTPDATLHYHAGMVYHRLGRSLLARPHLEQALKTNPHFSLLQAPEARKALAALKTGGQ